MLEHYRLIGDPRALAREGLFVAEGRLVVERLLEDGIFRVHSVLVTPAAARALAPVLQRRPDVPSHTRTPGELREMTGFDFHRGCLALAYRVESTATRETLAGAARVLALEGIGDPDNVGGLFRTALALGVEAVLLDSHTADPLYRKAVRTSMAATLRVPYLRAASWPDALDDLRRQGHLLVALTPRSGAVPLSAFAATVAGRLAILVGSEGFGLGEDTLAGADAHVRIPVDPRADSLNVVSAAAIALYALAPRLT